MSSRVFSSTAEGSSPVSCFDVGHFDRVQARYSFSVSTLPEVPTGGAVDAIRTGRVTLRSDGHLEMPADAVWPVADSRMLFVRKWYAPLFESLLEGCPRCTDADVPKHHRVITGQPGIGKSFFGWYVIYRVLTEQPTRTVIYASRATRAAWIITPGGIVHKMPLKTDADLIDLEYLKGLGDCPLLVADAYVPPPLPFPTVTIASSGHLQDAGPEGTRHLRAPYLCMPLPTADEVRSLRALAFPSVDADATERRMKLWGGIPRLVLEEVSDADQLRHWRDTASVPLSDLAIAARGGALGSRSAHHALVHEHAAGELGARHLDPTTPWYYQPDRPGFASAVITSRVLLRSLWARDPTAAAALLEGTPHTDATGAWHGTAAQWSALNVLREGGGFRTRSLSAQGERFDDYEYTFSGHRWPPTQIFDVAALSAHKAHADMLLLASGAGGGVAGLSALIWDNDVSHHWPVYVTHDHSGTFDAAALADAVTQLGWTPDEGWPSGGRTIMYYIAVPEQRFAEGWTRVCEPKAGTVNSELAAAVCNRLLQKAVCIPAGALVRRASEELEQPGVQFPEALLPARW